MMRPRTKSIRYRALTHLWGNVKARLYAAMPRSGPRRGTPHNGHPTMLTLPRRLSSLPDRLRALRDHLQALRGWRADLAATLSGIITALALPPLYLTPALLLGIPALLCLIHGASNP